MATPKPRKLRQPSKLDREHVTASVSSHKDQVFIDGFLMNLTDARRLHAWLGRYITWKEARDA